MTTEEMEKLAKMMMRMFNDGYEQVVIPRLEDLEEKMGEMKHDLHEAFKGGQKSLSSRLEEMEVDVKAVKTNTAEIQGDMEEVNQKMDKVIEKNEDYGKRLDKVERIVKAH